MEWTSLIIFTVIAQIAVGLVLVYWLLGFTGAAREKAPAYAAFAKPVLLGAWVLTGIAAVTSTTHLGWPFSAYRALAHLASSWLSREVVLELLFGALALGMWVMVQWGARTLSAWWYAGLAAVGVLATYSSGMIYTLPSIPANHNGFPVALFGATVLVTGGAAVLALLHATKSGRQLVDDLGKSVALFTLYSLVLSAVLTVTYASAAKSGTPEARQQAALLMGTALYPVRIIVGLLIPAGLAAWLARNARTAVAAVAVLALVVVAGELAGRWLFFTSTVFTGVNSGL